MAKIANSVIGTKPAEVDVVDNAKVEKKTKMPGMFAALLAFVATCAVLTMPVMAADPSINLTWVGTMFASLIEAFNLCAAPAQSFIETWFPVIVTVVIYGVILGIIAIVGYAVRGVLLAGVQMIQDIFKFK